MIIRCSSRKYIYTKNPSKIDEWKKFREKFPSPFSIQFLPLTHYSSYNILSLIVIIIFFLFFLLKRWCEHTGSGEHR